jgi:4-amino-4-deoxy-L-arabinose transferase-like glycosyltransferase
MIHSEKIRKLAVPFLLTLFVLIALISHLIAPNFPCLNSDEASFAYNAYSIFKTGKDEYGTSFPARFKAFGENKLPVIIYLTVPFMTMGLNDVSARMVSSLGGILAPLLFYFLAKELTKRKDVALVAAFLSSFSPWIQIMSRHLHEILIIYAIISLAVIYMLRFSKTLQLKYLALAALFEGIALFTYHIGKIFAPFFIMWLLFILYKQSNGTGGTREGRPTSAHEGALVGRTSSDGIWNVRFIATSLVILFIPMIIFAYTELSQPTSRVSNLVFYNNPGFIASIEELRKEHDVKLIHNKVTKSILQLSNQYLSYFSPEFLITHGDTNTRFGYKGISLITPIEYFFFFIGLYFLFKNKQEHRYLILALLLTAPLTAALSWQEYSATRSFYIVVPMLIIIAYGVVNFVSTFINKKEEQVARGRGPGSAQAFASTDGRGYRVTESGVKAYLIIGIALLLHFFFLFFTWDYYFNHYPQKPQAISSWQCGYKDLGSYIKENYSNFDTFYITRKLGQPYIFTLFYLNFPPGQYQKQAKLTELDEYGFGQVERFDKFEFSFKSPDAKEKAVYVGLPEDFSGTGIQESQIKKIQFNNQDIFWIYESK